MQELPRDETLLPGDVLRNNAPMQTTRASILPLMRANAPLRRLSSASNTAVALGIA